MLGLWVAEGSLHVSRHDTFLTHHRRRRAARTGGARSSSAISGFTSCGQAGGVGAGGVDLRPRPTADGADGPPRLRRQPQAHPGLDPRAAARTPQVVRRGIPRAATACTRGRSSRRAIRHEFSTVSDELKDDLDRRPRPIRDLPHVGRYDTTFKQKTGDRRYPFWRLTVANVSPWSPLDWDRGVVQKLNARRTGDIVWAPVTGDRPSRADAAGLRLLACPVSRTSSPARA